MSLTHPFSKTIFILGLMKIIDLNQFLFGAKKGLNQKFFCKDTTNKIFTK